MLATALLLAAAPPRPVWQGVWQGAIGTLPVRACLVRRGERFAVGAYYYLSRLRTIRLEQQDGSIVWREGEGGASGSSAPRWTFADVGAELLTGTWSDGRRSLALRLTRVANGDDDAPCGSDAFNAARWRPLTFTRRAAAKDGVGYAKLSYHAGPAFPEVELTSFALPGGDAASRRINLALRAAVPGKDEDWRGCIAGGLDAQGNDGDYQAGLEPTLITSRWLGAALTIGSYCGGAHPNTDTRSLTFDRASGKAVELSDWLNDAAVKRSREGGRDASTVRPALRRVIIAHAGEIEAECRDPVAEAEYWDIGLDRAGLRFTPEMPHVLTPCADPVLVPWSALARFLSPAGAAGRGSVVVGRGRPSTAR